MRKYVARCLRGEGTLPEAVFGVFFIGSLLVGACLWVVLALTEATAAYSAVLFACNAAYFVFLLFASVCVWRCALNFRYRAVGITVRVMVFIYLLAILGYIYYDALNFVPKVSS